MWAVNNFPLVWAGPHRPEVVGERRAQRRGKPLAHHYLIAGLPGPRRSRRRSNPLLAGTKRGRGRCPRSGEQTASGLCIRRRSSPATAAAACHLLCCWSARQCDRGHRLSDTSAGLSAAEEGARSKSDAGHADGDYPPLKRRASRRSNFGAGRAHGAFRPVPVTGDDGVPLHMFEEMPGR